MGSTWGDANEAMPKGYHPHRITEPPRIDLDAKTASDDEPVVVAQGDLRVTADALGSIEILADVLNRSTGGGSPVAQQIAGMARFWKQHVRLIGGLAVALLVAVGLSVAPVGGQAAQAMEAPQPDPAVAAYRVTLGAAPVTVYVRANVYTETAPGWWCASAWTARGRIGGTCSISPSFPIPVRIDPRTFPAGRTFAQVVDDASDVAVSNVTFDARRPSRFGVGTWTPTQYGDGLTVSARLYAYTPAVGAWTPQQNSPVRVQELRAGRWVTVAKATTNRRGAFLVTFIIGGGPHTLRVRRDTGATVAPVNGTARHFYLSPTDVPDGVI